MSNNVTLPISTFLLTGIGLAIAQEQPIVIKAGLLLDGKGGAQKNVSVTVVGSKIEKLGAAGKTTTYDLSGLTLLPGMIDTHVHIGWHFGPDGRYQPHDNLPESARLCTRKRVCHYYGRLHHNAERG